MTGLEVLAALAAIICAIPVIQSYFQSLKNHPIMRDSQASSSNEPQPPLHIAPRELLALEQAMGNIPLILQLSRRIDDRTRGITIFLIQLREAAYAADDLLDELDYEDLRLRVLVAETGTPRAEADTLHVAIDTEEGMATGAADVQPLPTAQVGCITWLKLFFTQRPQNCCNTCITRLKLFFTKLCQKCCFSLESPPQTPSEPTPPPPPAPPLPPESLHLSSSSSNITAEGIRTTIDDQNQVASRLKDIYPLISESSRTTGGWKEKVSATVITGSRVTTSTVNASRVYGRDEKKKEIMDMIQTPQIHGLRISIIAIVGVGGVGKTTLAQYVFNEEKLETLFHHKVWICVSDEYTTEKIIKEIIISTVESREKTSIELQSIMNMDTLKRMLKNNMKNTNLLLVLDDVRSDQWTKIILPLHDIVELCKIIVTTREEKNVMLPAEFPHCQLKILVLEGLDQTPSEPTPPPPPVLPLPPESLHLSSSSNKITAERIRSTIDDLNRVASGLKDIYPLISESLRTTGGGKEKGLATVITSSRVTTSTVNSRKVYGRDEKKKEIMDMLQTPQIDGENEPRISIIAIAGVSGVGKTTLAQYVFNDEKLETLFHHKVWICVNDENIKEQIIKEIIIDTADSKERTSIVLQSISSMDTLECMLKHNLENKRLLLVLDDVRSNQWIEILLPLQNIIELCKIIVTTPEEKNVTLPHCKCKILTLEGLDAAVYQRLFDEHAFGTQGPFGHPKGQILQPISCWIAKKLNGSPLAAKIVGAVVRERLDDVDHWRRVLESDLWCIENQKTGDIMPALMLSYLHLPTCLQRCFSYCAIFPKGYEFQKEDLVNMWIAQSYVSCTSQDERPEDVGLQHFEDLVSRSFFEYYDESYPSCYKMHDLLHDLALFVSLKDCSVYHSGIWHGDPETCHHLSITGSQKLPENLTEHLLESVKLKLEHVRTLIIDSFEKAPEILKSMKKVRVVKVLKYTYTDEKVSLPDIGHLIHLRYLDLSKILIPNVTESICTLYHLQTLLFNPDVQIRFPERMYNLVNLHHLFANKTSIARIPFIGKLSQLQELEYFDCEYNNIGQLKEMNELGGKLCIINMEKAGSTHDAENASLCKKRRLKKLKLKYNTIYNDAFAEHHDTVLQFLRPNEQLEELKIGGHPGYKPPNWIVPSSLSYIERIYLSGCSHWRKLSGIAKLPHLERLSMINMRLVIELGEADSFPSLVEIELNNVSLSFKKSQVHGRMFPNLQLMDLTNCEKLAGLMKPSSLKILYIDKCDIELPIFLKGLSSLTTLKIKNQDRFTTFDGEVMDSLSSLEELAIRHCKNFRFLPKGGFPSSLVKLEVVRCSQELHDKLKDHNSPEWSMIQHIPNTAFKRI